MVKLNSRQSRFVQEYLIDLNATQSAIRAGYSKKTAKSQGQRLLTHVDVAAAIASGQAKRSKRTAITQDSVLKSIVETLDRCRQVEPVLKPDGSPVMVKTKDGTMVPAFKFDAANALKAAELLGKHLVMFTDRVDHTSSDGTMATGNMTEDQIEAEIAIRLAKIEDERATVH